MLQVITPGFLRQKTGSVPKQGEQKGNVESRLILLSQLQGPWWAGAVPKLAP